MSTLDKGKELEILRDAVDRAESKNKNQTPLSESVQNIIKLKEDYIQSHELICYCYTT